MDHKALRQRMKDKHDNARAICKEIEYPLPDLKGPRGNAPHLLSEANVLMNKAGIPEDIRSQFQTDAMSGDYDHLLDTIQRWFKLVVPITEYVPFNGDVRDLLKGRRPLDESLEASIASAEEEFKGYEGNEKAVVIDMRGKGLPEILDALKEKEGNADG